MSSKCIQKKIVINLTKKGKGASVFDKEMQKFFKSRNLRKNSTMKFSDLTHHSNYNSILKMVKKHNSKNIRNQRLRRNLKRCTSVEIPETDIHIRIATDFSNINGLESIKGKNVFALGKLKLASNILNSSSCERHSESKVSPLGCTIDSIGRDLKLFKNTGIQKVNRILINPKQHDQPQKLCRRRINMKRGLTYFSGNSYESFAAYPESSLQLQGRNVRRAETSNSVLRGQTFYNSSMTSDNYETAESSEDTKDCNFVSSCSSVESLEHIMLPRIVS
ncbi:unnamed protein product [Moneuplotes crassus]|uniref:Uncharacterized protein n=1 Tax=Euplotes crassus TaxID=5936 RepID=A0AAD1XLC1_EUPCR|nr:unnamed protein product [Moneuplotes crassus]